MRTAGQRSRETHVRLVAQSLGFVEQIHVVQAVERGNNCRSVSRRRRNARPSVSLLRLETDWRADAPPPSPPRTPRARPGCHPAIPRARTASQGARREATPLLGRKKKAACNSCINNGQTPLRCRACNCNIPQLPPSHRHRHHPQSRARRRR